MPRAAVEEELIAKNEVEIPPVPAELEDWAKEHPIHVFNCSPETFRIHHPIMGVVTIHGCEEGKEYSQATIIPGLIPYGVRVEMTTAELRHESGRQFAVDLVGLGAFKDGKKSLWARGVFIAANDTFEPNEVKSFKIGSVHGKHSSISLPVWVDMKIGETSEEPTRAEVKAARKRAADWDRYLVAEADSYHDQGASKEIQAEHRHAARRLGQVRPWDQPLIAMQDCPGCGAKVPPGIARHSCGAILDWNKAIALGIAKEEDRPAGSAQAKK